MSICSGVGRFLQFSSYMNIVVLSTADLLDLYSINISFISGYFGMAFCKIYPSILNIGS